MPIGLYLNELSDQGLLCEILSYMGTLSGDATLPVSFLPPFLQGSLFEKKNAPVSVW